MERLLQRQHGDPVKSLSWLPQRQQQGLGRPSCNLSVTGVPAPDKTPVSLPVLKQMQILVSDGLNGLISFRGEKLTAFGQQNRGHGDDGDERRSPQQSQQHLPLRLQTVYISPVRSSPSAPVGVRGSGPELAPLATGGWRRVARGGARIGRGHGGLGGFGVSQGEVVRAAALDLVASEQITLCFYYARTSETRGECWRAFSGCPPDRPRLSAGS